MNDQEAYAHTLITRLIYLLERFEKEFFHVHPDLKQNCQVKSLALSSILNEALNLHEATFPGKSNRDYFKNLVTWGNHQDWNWNDVAIRFTWWPVCETIKPFCFDAKGLAIRGREANNRIKHHGDMATFEDTLNACAAAWFLVLEKARETKVFIGESELQKTFKIFDCYDLIDSLDHGYGHMICRPLINKVCYPAVRGQSEIEDAKQAFEQRMTRRSKSKKS